MSNSPSVLMARPTLGYRSISELAPLYDPSSAPHSGTRLRGSKATSGTQTAAGSQLPYSPLLPLPPASTSKMPLLHPDSAVEQRENVAPSTFHDEPIPSNHAGAIAARRQARRGVSEGYTFHSHEMKPNRTSALSTKAALRLHIAASSDPSAHPAAGKAAGMIRSYSLPVATQEEHDEQQRVMALGLTGQTAANPAWWQYGWPSPGGLNHHHVHKTERSRSQSKLSNALSPLSPLAPIEPATTTPRAGKAAKTHSSCSPKMKSKHLPSMHQHALHASRSASTSPKLSRSPLAPMSTNLPALEQQTEKEEMFDVEMDALNARFAEWSRAQEKEVDEEQDDYFNLVHDDPVVLLRAAGGSDTSDEARTPRASSPRPTSKMHAALEEEGENRWSGNFDFIHPDHLA
ncbi:hypothetical protein PSEUBRA_004749 [Kalmanozyma brasiliensis GHG001]|uniref:Uncharacterized protein n=1 Tax=Kalmanozyma brasiliensis (strain GHG001) TaxID=1365824 RepID=V5EL37_KALBG|nr:uncharacterized protein PSEUBRA_004749 [Kalmanozyma brasiliensis GHG001]EST05735.1 hypothetical protein PSEUBRA_004749 [Kalmanozyma brasiliensis GHG001]